MRIIFPRVTCREALGLASLKTLFDRRQAQTVKMFQDISDNPDHKLYRFLPETNKRSFNLRNSRRYHVPISRAISTAIIYGRFHVSHFSTVLLFEFICI